MNTIRRIAKVAHACWGDRDCTIAPGDNYVEIVYPPWVMIKDDPEYPAHPQGYWEHMRYCTDHANQMEVC